MDTRILLCLPLGLALPAADPPARSWPQVISVGIEEVKPGKDAAHQANEFAWVKTLAQAKSPYHCLGMVPVSGAPQAWWVWPMDALADLEKRRAHLDVQPAIRARIDTLSAKDGEYLTGFRGGTYLLVGDLSHGPGSLAPRHYWISTLRLRPGRDGDFLEAVTTFTGHYQKAGLQPKWAIYQAVIGAANPTYLWVIPLHSLAEADAVLAEDRKMAASAGPEALKALSRTYGDCVLEEDSQLLSVDPKLSYPSAQDVALDPGFWKVWAAKPIAKPAATTAAKAGAK
jgi:hypothetical protein